MGDSEAVAVTETSTTEGSVVGRWSNAAWPRRAVRVSVAAALGCVGVLALVSLAWPRSWDASIMEYVSWLVNQGARPYRDVFDMNFPGSYIFHGIGQRLTGTSELGFRLRDMAVLLGALALLYKLMRRFPWPTAAAAVVLVAVQYLVVSGPEGSLQRDWLIAIGVLGAVALLLASPKAWRTVLAGAVIGAAVSIKPNAALMLLVVPTAVFGAGLCTTPVPPARRRGVLMGTVRSFLVVMGLFLVGAMVAVGAVLAWVALSGGWADFTWISRNYMSLYSLLSATGMETGSRWASLTQVASGTIRRPEFFLFILGAPVVLLRQRSRGELRLVIVLLAVGAAGLVQALSAGKGWDYHYWTWTLAMLSVVAVAVGDVWTGQLISWRRLPRWISPVVSFLFLCALMAWFQMYGMKPSMLLGQGGGLVLVTAALPVGLLALLDVMGALGDPQVFAKKLAASPIAALVLSALFLGNAASLLHAATSGTPDVRPSSEYAIAEVLQEHMAPGDRVQILATIGGKEAALRAQAKNATPFIYDFHFFHDVGSDVNKELRSRFMAAWDQQPPEFVVVYYGDGVWSHRTSLRDLESFPELAEALTGYTPIFTNNEAEVLMRGHG